MYKCKEIREAAGIRATDIALRARIDRSRLCAIERGYACPNAAESAAIRAALVSLAKERLAGAEGILSGKLEIRTLQPRR